MVSLNEKFPSANRWHLSVQSLILGRLVLIFLIFAVTWIWYSKGLRLSVENFPRDVFVVFTISVGLTIVYSFLLRISDSLPWQVRLQFVLDALLITWLVWRTGTVSSPYIVLYIILIGVSGGFLKPLSTFIVALGSVLLLCAVSLLSEYSVIESFSGERSFEATAQALTFDVAAFLIVGLLASRLSDQAVGDEQLKEATKSLANLRALHERIVESIRSGLITTDLDGTIFTFNAAASEITGYKPEDMEGKKIDSLFGDIGNEIDTSLHRTETGDSQPRFEARLATPDGFEIRIGYSITQLLSENNVPTGLIITFQDLTEIRSMEESIRRKERLAAVGRVGAGLAHEIRNPLGAMRGAIQVLESNFPQGSIHADLMGIILRESDRLNSIITNFLSYARPKVGKYEETDVREAIRDTIKLLEHSPDVKDFHTLEQHLPTEPVFIKADATQLKQIFWNLARNAVQAMPDGGTLGVTLEQITSNRVRIVFEDTGVGMSPESVEQLFEPFSNSTSGGTGLGLSIVYQIIRDHNGTINVRSFEGEGTIITVELPAQHRFTPPPEPDENIDESVAPSRLKELLNVRNPD